MCGFAGQGKSAEMERNTGKILNQPDGCTIIRTESGDFSVFRGIHFPEAPDQVRTGFPENRLL